MLCQLQPGLHFRMEIKDCKGMGVGFEEHMCQLKLFEDKLRRFWLMPSSSQLTLVMSKVTVVPTTWLPTQV